MRTDVATKSTDVGNGDQVMVRMESFWIRIVERLGALGVLMFVLWYVFTSLIPSAQAQFERSLKDSREAFTETLKVERDSFSKSLKDQRDDFLESLQKLHQEK